RRRRRTRRKRRSDTAAARRSPRLEAVVVAEAPQRATCQASLLLQKRDGRGSEKDARPAGLFGVGVGEDGPQRLLVKLRGAGAGPAADGTAGAVDLHGAIHVPGLAVIPRDDELDLLAAESRPDDPRRQQPAVLQGNHLVPPPLRRDVREGLDGLPG